MDKRHSTNVIKVILLAYKLGAFHFEIYWTIKSTLGFGSLFYNPINIIVCVGVMDMGVIYLRLQTCWNDFISIFDMFVDIAINMNTCSMLLGWDLWSHMVNNRRSFPYTMFSWHLILNIYFHPMCCLHVRCIHKFNYHMLHLLPFLHLYNLSYKLMYNLF